MATFGKECDIRTDIARVDALSRYELDLWENASILLRGEPAVDYASIVSRIRDWRYGLFSRDGTHTPFAGDMLLYFYDLSMDDGIAQDASGGLFDVCNRPPPLFWILHVEDSAASSYDLSQLGFGSRPRYIAAWIPESFIARAKAGVEANAERCLYWLADNECQGLRDASSLADCVDKWRARWSQPR